MKKHIRTPSGRRRFLGWLLTFPALVVAACKGATSNLANHEDTTSEPTSDGQLADDNNTTADDTAPATVDTTPPDVVNVPCEPTEEDLLGPYYEPDAPATAVLASEDEPGERMNLSGRILGPDCKTPVSGALVEIWQADEAGNYFDEKFRTALTVGDDGHWSIQTIMPGRYLQPSGLRPAHVHLQVIKPGYETLVTQVYFEGDPYLGEADSCGVCASDDPARIITLTTTRTGILQGEFDAILASA